MFDVRVLTAIVLLSCLASCVSEQSGSGETGTNPAPDQEQPAPAAHEELDIPRLRGALGERGAGLSDEDVAFIHRCLLASDGEYTERGLETYLEWGLEARVTTTADKLELWVVPTTGNVNADWALEIDRETGEVTDVWSSTFFELPPAG